MNRRFGKITRCFCVAFAALLPLLVSCSKDLEFNHPNGETCNTGTPITRVANDETRKVLLLYSCGFNSLSMALKSDINDMLKGAVPGNDRSDDVVLVYGQHVSSTYEELSSPVLFRAYTKEGIVVRDTLKIWPSTTISASSATLKEVLTYVKDEFPAKEYDFLFSSHATGWLPLAYYSDMGSNYDQVPTAVGEEREPLTKSMGQTLVGNRTAYKSYSMTIASFAKAFPMKIENMLLDCCLSGGVEVAYELREACNRIVFSPAEILSDGFAYETLLESLFDSSDPAAKIADDYYQQYAAKTGSGKSATISVVDCRYVEDLAQVCAKIYANHPDAVQTLKGDNVQRYYRYSYSYFFDLRDVLVKAGASIDELAEFDGVMAKCIPYKAATESFMTNFGGFTIKDYSGLSCYLPAMGDSTTDATYRTLEWNNATGLLK